MTAAKKMGFEGEIFYGVAGATATNRIENSRDITENWGTETGSTKVRGNGSSPPIDTKRTTGLTYSLTWQMLEKSDDSTLAAIRAAWLTGDPVAIRTKAHSTGKGIDGDMIITSIEEGRPLNGEATVDITAEPNDDLRAFQLNV